EQTVLSYINNASEPHKPQPVAEALDFNFNTTRVILYNLKKRGLIRTAESGGFEKLAETRQAKV
ncbi:MAG: hypothetical protein WBE37_26460, partial [Bryobacteraceae bacterium]